MNITVDFPDEIGKVVAQLPDMNEFLVKAARVALEDKQEEEELLLSIQEADRGEYATEEVNAFFAKWSNLETRMD